MVYSFGLTNCTIFFFFNDTATTEIYTLSLHDALPICAARRLHQARQGDRRKDRGRGHQGHGRGRLMVRMSDLVRGIVRESPPAPPPARPAPPERSREPAEVTPMRLMSLASLGTAPSVERHDPAPPAPEPRVPEPPAESPEPLFGEIQAFLGEAQQRLRGGGAFPWGPLQALVDRAITALPRSADLFL